MPNGYPMNPIQIFSFGPHITKLGLGNCWKNL